MRLLSCQTMIGVQTGSIASTAGNVRSVSNSNGSLCKRRVQPRNRRIKSSVQAGRNADGFALRELRYASPEFQEPHPRRGQSTSTGVFPSPCEIQWHTLSQSYLSAARGNALRCRPTRASAASPSAPHEPRPDAMAGPATTRAYRSTRSSFYRSSRIVMTSAASPVSAAADPTHSVGFVALPSDVDHVLNVNRSTIVCACAPLRVK